jgi:hypothetical protein
MWESSLILGISCAWRRELNPRAYQHSQAVNQDLTEPAGNRITCFGTPLLAWSGNLDGVRLPRLVFLSSWEPSSSTRPCPT